MVILLLIVEQGHSALFWVGDTPQCNQANHYETLNLALLQAIINGSENDEIRLTDSVSYFGEANGDYRLTNWNSGGNGTLTITGGYANCDGTLSGRTVIGENTKDIFDITDNSTVTLNNIEITLGQKRGIKVSDQSTVFLNNVDIAANQSGIEVSEGSFLQADESTLVQFNQDFVGTPKGGGLHCYGSNSQVSFSGRMLRNRAQSGGNIYIEDGCFVILEGGAHIEGTGSGPQKDAVSGGGVFVHDGGELLADGDQDRVIMSKLYADFGGAIYVWGTGRVTLLNTFISGGAALDKGTAIYAINGGTSVNQLVMDRAIDCPFLISCSEIDGNLHLDALVYVSNSKIQINRTLFDNNAFFTTNNDINGMIEVTSTGKIELNRVNFIRNEAFYLIENYGVTEMTHITAVDNDYDETPIGSDTSFAWYNTGTLQVENSIFQQTQGARNTGVASGKCNMVNDGTDWPNGSFVIGTPVFNSVLTGDARQLSFSPAVDMCQRDTFAWSSERDIEYQTSPVNENTNPQGMPGENGGLYDAGFDEVYDNIGEDEFLLTVQKEGSGNGTVLSTPLGISCGTDCTEVYFNGTLVTLFADASAGSEFIRWRGCPLVSGDGDCLASITESMTIFAEFQPDDLIYSSGFE